MDTSETYIKMCEKAEEIQSLRTMKTLKNGDFYWCSWMGKAVASRYKSGVEVMMQILDYTSNLGGYNCWLPRQDQLQKMVGGFPDNINSFYLFCGEFAYPEPEWVGLCSYTQQFTSMEQLWLAFVMKKKYSKVWKDDKWV